MKFCTLNIAILVSLLLILTIILAIHRIKAKVRKNKNQQELQEAKDKFYTSITHEFRTPLTVIQSAAQNIMKHSSQGSVVHDDAANIVWYGNILLNLINQILDTTKMVSGSVPNPEWKHGDIVPFISMVCESYKLLAADKGIKIKYRPREDSLEMDFAPDYIHKILQNLIANSIKFSHKDSVIQVSTEISGNKLLLIVTDSGIGMTTEQKSNIFKAFYQASTEVGGIDSSGSGIGLPLVKLLLDSIGGDIEAFSLENEGTSFIVKLPLKYGSHSHDTVNKEDWAELTMVMPENKIELKDDISDDMESTRILIIEDSPAVARYMSTQLNPDYQISFATNGEEGLKKASEIVPDLIITDILMPGIDGLELCRRIRASELLHHIPVVMVTAKASHEDMIKGLEAGAEAYIEKPFQSDELQLRVEKLLELRQALREKYSNDLEEREIGNPPPVASGDRIFMARFVNLAMESIKSGDVDLIKLAEKMNVSRTQLNRKIKAISGMTTTGYIINLRVRMAKSLLRGEENLNINEISYRCGIDDVPYFVTMFKKATGMTPTQYRRQRG